MGDSGTNKPMPLEALTFCGSLSALVMFSYVQLYSV